MPNLQNVDDIEEPLQTLYDKLQNSHMKYVEPFLETLLLDRVAHDINS